MLNNFTFTPFNNMVTIRAAVNLSSISTSGNNCLTVYIYISKFHADAYGHSFAIRVTFYWDVLHNNIVLSPNLHLFSDNLHYLHISIFMRVQL